MKTGDSDVETPVFVMVFQLYVLFGCEAFLIMFLQGLTGRETVTVDVCFCAARCLNWIGTLRL